MREFPPPRFILGVRLFDWYENNIKEENSYEMKINKIK